jgi:hypothetical protein
MDCGRFNNLKLDDQLQTVMRHGTLLYEYKRYNLICRLFALQDLYVEIISNYDSKEVLTIAAYKELDSLEHILAEIDISPLLS